MAKTLPQPSDRTGPPKGAEKLGRRGRVLVLNATYEPINVCSVRRAVVLLIKRRAEIVDQGHSAVRAESLAIPRPQVIRLVSYVRVPRDAHRRKITRRAVFARDGWSCQYCGDPSNLTVDHVIPRSKGGLSSWENVVTSCAPCNRRKADKLPAAIGMQPRRKPKAPGPQVFIRIASPKVPLAWQPYLADAA
ncbi:MAG: HNH endonuclease [Actinomycetes bacterium]